MKRDYTTFWGKNVRKSSGLHNWNFSVIWPYSGQTPYLISFYCLKVLCYTSDSYNMYFSHIVPIECSRFFILARSGRHQVFFTNKICNNSWKLFSYYNYTLASRSSLLLSPETPEIKLGMLIFPLSQFWMSREHKWKLAYLTQLSLLKMIWTAYFL